MAWCGTVWYSIVWDVPASGGGGAAAPSTTAAPCRTSSAPACTSLLGAAFIDAARLLREPPPGFGCLPLVSSPAALEASFSASSILFSQPACLNRTTAQNRTHDFLSKPSAVTALCTGCFSLLMLSSATRHVHVFHMSSSSPSTPTACLCLGESSAKGTPPTCGPGILSRRCSRY